MNRFFKFIATVFVVCLGLLTATQPASAAITWDFADVTGELAGLGTALVTAGGLAVAGALVVYGLYKAVTVVLKLFSRTSSKG
ncbi:MAG TPA: hypothetical protein VG710_17910 [Opitutus sp.]|nr:hypothetical protein [Opitutus sp.]